VDQATLSPPEGYKDGSLLDSALSDALSNHVFGAQHIQQLQVIQRLQQQRAAMLAARAAAAANVSSQQQQQQQQQQQNVIIDPQQQGDICPECTQCSECAAAKLAELEAGGEFEFFFSFLTSLTLYSSEN
jgi:type II secretory pathway component GspD/PulD (secretin)